MVPTPPSSGSTGVQKPRQLKQLLQAGYELLQPPAPLSDDVDTLRRQLERSERTLDDELYRSYRDEGCECRQLADGQHSEDTTQDLRCLILSRSQCLLSGMQSILEKEYLPVERRDGLSPSDFLLGTGDLRLIRAMLSLIMDHCLARCTRLILHIETAEQVQLLALAKHISVMLSFCALPQQSHSSRATNAAANDTETTGETSTPRVPPTAITQHVHLHFVPKIVLACTLVAWPPTLEPKVMASLRTQFLGFYRTEGTTNSMLGHSIAAVRLATGKDPNDETGWNRVWPRYAVTALCKQMDDLVATPGGVKALIYNAMGKDAIVARKMPTPIQMKAMYNGVPIRARRSSGSPSGPVDQVLSQLYDIVSSYTDMVDVTSEPLLYIGLRLIDLCWTHEPEKTMEWFRINIFAWLETVGQFAIRQGIPCDILDAKGGCGKMIFLERALQHDGPKYSAVCHDSFVDVFELELHHFRLLDSTRLSEPQRATCTELHERAMNLLRTLLQCLDRQQAYRFLSLLTAKHGCIAASRAETDLDRGSRTTSPIVGHESSSPSFQPETSHRHTNSDSHNSTQPDFLDYPPDDLSGFVNMLVSLFSSSLAHWTVPLILKTVQERLAGGCVIRDSCASGLAIRIADGLMSSENAFQVINELDPVTRHSASSSLDGLEEYTPDLPPMIQAALGRIRTSLLTK